MTGGPTGSRPGRWRRWPGRCAATRRARSSGSRTGCSWRGSSIPAARARAVALRAAIPPPDPGAALAGLEILAATDLRPTLAAVDLPTLVVHGERDPVCPSGAGRALAEAIPGARLSLLAGAGHAPFLSRPDALAASLLPFLDG